MTDRAHARRIAEMLRTGRAELDDHDEDEDEVDNVED